MTAERQYAITTRYAPVGRRVIRHVYVGFASRSAARRAAGRLGRDALPGEDLEIHVVLLLDVRSLDPHSDPPEDPPPGPEPSPEPVDDDATPGAPTTHVARWWQ